ncbi:unnamed protein product [Ixodes persulcatus]
MVDATLLATEHPSRTCKQQPVHTMLQELLQPCMSFADRSNAEARKCCVPSVEMRASVVHTASCVPSAYKPMRNKSAVAFGISCENSESSPLHMVQSFCRQCMYDSVAIATTTIIHLFFLPIRKTCAALHMQFC